MRTYMQRRSGYRNIRGGHVIEIQKNLANSDIGITSIDGVFDGQTETALKLWQNKKIYLLRVWLMKLLGSEAPEKNCPVSSEGV